MSSTRTRRPGPKNRVVRSERRSSSGSIKPRRPQETYDKPERPAFRPAVCRADLKVGPSISFETRSNLRVDVTFNVLK